MQEKVPIARHTDVPPHLAARLQFDRYVLDLQRGCLLLDGEEIALRPKTFAVLRFLVENCDRLISKDELFAAVWPDIAVTDDALVQSIGELRRALVNDGARLIRTIPRRGYRFEASASPVSSEILSPKADPPVPTAPGEAAQSPETPSGHTGVPPPRAQSRRLLLASSALVLLLAAVVLGSGATTGWRFLDALRRPGLFSAQRPETGDRPAIAVLPFLSESGDPSRGYFADGLTQDVINALGRFSELTVMSWNAVAPYRNKSPDPREIARRLAVRYEVEGSVRQAGDRLSVSAQLVDADGRVLWSARFDEALADLFTLQDGITTQIAQALPIRVQQIEQRRVLAKRTESLEAYDYVLRARPALQRPARAAIADARGLLRQAIRLDPNYAAAYAGLAETYYVAVALGWAESPTEFLGRAADMADKALSSDSSDVRARITLGRIDIFYHRYDQALAELDRALAFNPNDATALAGRGNVLMWLGQTDPAIRSLEQAQRIDPDLNPMDRFALSLAYYLKRRYDAAIDQAEINLREIASANFSRVVLAAAYAEDGRPGDAARVAATIRRVDPTFDPTEFGIKFLNPVDLAQLREGLRQAGLFPAETGPRPN